MPNGNPRIGFFYPPSYIVPMKVYYLSFYSDDCVDNDGCNPDEICREDGACGKLTRYMDGVSDQVST